MSYDKLTWNAVLKNNKIDLVEHPVYGGLVEKLEFNKEFELVLKGLNGGQRYPTPDCYFGFFVEMNPAFQSSLRFRGEDEKGDFIDIAIEKGIMPSLEEIYQAETIEEQRERQTDQEWNTITKIDDKEAAEIDAEIEHQRIKSIETQRQKQFERTESRSEFFREYILLHNIWKGCSKNMNRMLDLKNKDTNEEEKIEKAERKFRNSLEKIREQYKKLWEKYGSQLEMYPEYDVKIAETLSDIKTVIDNY